MRYIILCLIAVLLAGCETDGVGPSSLKPVCAALIGPIKYNTFNKASQRYAAKVLAVDLSKRNQVGRRLGCQKFK